MFMYKPQEFLLKLPYNSDFFKNILYQEYLFLRKYFKKNVNE